MTPNRKFFTLSRTAMILGLCLMPFVFIIGNDYSLGYDVNHATQNGDIAWNNVFAMVVFIPAFFLIINPILSKMVDKL